MNGPFPTDKLVMHKLITSIGNKDASIIRFFYYGIFVIISSNGLLQLLLITNALSIGISTLLSQVLGALMGYFLYGKLVFQVKKTFSGKSMAKYSLVVTFLWLANWMGISCLTDTGLSRSVSAIIMIVPLAGLSYLLQKCLVFANSQH